MGEKRYWLTPPEIEAEVVRILGTEAFFDPCPYPRPVDWDALKMTWHKPWYCNPPFNPRDGGPTAFVRKAIKEGGPGLMILPSRALINLLLEAEIELRSAGRPRWLDCISREPMKAPSAALWAYFKPRPSVKEADSDG